MNIFSRLGQKVYDYRWIVLIIWLVISVSSAFYAWRLPTVLKGSGFVAENMEASVGRNLLHDRLQLPLAQVSVLLETTDGETLDSPTARKEIERLTSELRDVPHVVRVTAPLPREISKDGRIGYISVGLDLNEDDSQIVLPDLQKKIQSNEFRTTLAGDAAFYDDVNRASQNDLKKAEAIGLPMTLIVLVLAFGTLVAAGLPIMIGVVSAGVTLAILYGLGQLMPLSVFVLNIPTMLGIAVGVDYSLLFVTRFREELQSNSVRDAVIRTMGTAGRSVFFSGLTVAIGISSMIFWDMMITRSVMIGGMIVVVLTMLSSLTLLPAVLGILGNKVNRARVLPATSVQGDNGWYRFAHFVMARPLTNILIATVILIGLIIPIRHLEFAIPGIEALPKTYSSHQAMATLYDTFGEERFNPIVVALEHRTSDVNSDTGIRDLAAYTKWIQAQPHVQQVQSFTSLQPQLRGVPDVQKLWVAGPMTQVVVTMDVPVGSSAAKDLVRDLRNHKPAEFQAWVTGATAANMDFTETIIDHIPEALMYTFFVTYVLLFLAFQSVILPLKALLMNSLSLLAAFGVLVMTFQDINTILPVFIFAFVFGTSMDYEVFMISRIQEEYLTHGDNLEATAKGLAVTSRLITSAALILILLTGSFIFTDVLPVKQIGLGLASAVFLDAGIIRLFMVPSLMRLLGKWNWWAPKWMRRWKIHI